MLNPSLSGCSHQRVRQDQPNRPHPYPTELTGWTVASLLGIPSNAPSAQVSWRSPCNLHRARDLMIARHQLARRGGVKVIGDQDARMIRAQVLVGPTWSVVIASADPPGLRSQTQAH